jgi:hypothetical protein
MSALFDKLGENDVLPQDVEEGPKDLFCYCNRCCYKRLNTERVRNVCAAYSTSSSPTNKLEFLLRSLSAIVMGLQFVSLLRGTEIGFTIQVQREH